MPQKLTGAPAQQRAVVGSTVLAWSLVPRGRLSMEQHPKLTLDWALRCLERALGDLSDGPAERRVRRQFHQLLLAIERDAREVPPRSEERRVGKEGGYRWAACQKGEHN